MNHQETEAALRKEVKEIVATTPVRDIHTHLYDPAFGSLLLWGIDDLLTYHYLVAETFRYLKIPAAKFWALTKEEQAGLIWKELFVENSPISEACRGVITTLHALGLEPRHNDLSALRQWFRAWKPDAFIDRCLELSGVRSVCMTNSPFDDLERPVWEKGFTRDDRFTAALRIDPLLVSWEATVPTLAAWGYKVTPNLSDPTVQEVRRFLRDWTGRLRAQYLMVSLPPDFDFPGASLTAQLLEKAVLPHCQEAGLPMALMLGVKRQVNPQLQMAGDGVGTSRLSALANLCHHFPGNRFLVTVLARENQYELCVLARKFRNLHIFGCWWFTNVPSLVDEITRLRLELLGLSVTPQHSDARVLDQLIYKWRHSRQVIGEALADKYVALAKSGWCATRSEIERDVTNLFGGAFETFCRG